MKLIKIQFLEVPLNDFWEVQLHSWGRSLIEPPKNKLLISHDINCFNDVCIANKENAYADKVYVIQKNEKLIFCKVAGT